MYEYEEFKTGRDIYFSNTLTTTYSAVTDVFLAGICWSNFIYAWKIWIGLVFFIRTWSRDCEQRWNVIYMPSQEAGVLVSRPR